MIQVGEPAAGPRSTPASPNCRFRIDLERPLASVLKDAITQSNSNISARRCVRPPRQRRPLCEDLRPVATQHHRQDRRVQARQGGVQGAVAGSPGSRVGLPSVGSPTREPGQFTSPASLLTLLARPGGAWVSPGLHEPFETLQVFLDLGFGVLAEQVGQGHAEIAGRRIVFQHHFYQGPALVRGRFRSVPNPRCPRWLRGARPRQ